MRWRGNREATGALKILTSEEFAATYLLDRLYWEILAKEVDQQRMEFGDLFHIN